MNAGKRRAQIIYKYLPFAGLALLTAILMVVFKTSDSTNDALKQGKDAIIEFYTKNLVPIFTKTEINSEDIFNFAMYSQIPVDKDRNKILKIGEDQSGSKFFQVKPGEYNPDTKNMERFEKFLQLDDQKKTELTELLDSYRDELYSTVLYNENNTYAVNPNIELLRKSIAADLYEFATTVNPERSAYLVKTSGNDLSGKIRELKTTLRMAEDNNVANFIFFGPDTIFSQKCDIDKKEIKRLAREHSVAFATGNKVSVGSSSSSSVARTSNVLRPMPELPPVSPVPHVAGLAMSVNENDSKATIPRGVFVDNFIGSNHALAFDLDSLNSAIKNFTFNVTSDSSNYMRFSINEDDGNYNFSMDFNAIGINEVVNVATAFASEDNLREWENFGGALDSMMQDLEININDTSILLNGNGFKFKMNNKNKKK